MRARVFPRCHEAYHDAVIGPAMPVGVGAQDGVRDHVMTSVRKGVRREDEGVDKRCRETGAGAYRFGLP